MRGAEARGHQCGGQGAGVAARECRGAGVATRWGACARAGIPWQEPSASIRSQTRPVLWYSIISTSYADITGRESELTFESRDLSMRAGAVLVHVQAQSKDGKWRWPIMRLDGIVLPWDINKYGKLSVPAGDETVFGCWVVKLEREVQALAARAGWHFTGTRRKTPKGIVIDAKPCKAGAVVTDSQGVPIDGSQGKLGNHMVDLVLSVDGLWVQNGTLSVRWRFHKITDHGAQSPQPMQDWGAYQFLDAGRGEVRQ